MATLLNIDSRRIDELIGRFAAQSVVVAGDMVADEYIFGTPTRLSREAPVVVLEYLERRLVPGGATNVAVNLRSLGADVIVIGVIGDDSVGRELAGALQDLGIDVTGLIVDPERPTSIKTRIVGGGPQVVRQQIVRIDRADSRPLEGNTKRRVLGAASWALGRSSAVILSDYEHGVIDPQLIDLCLPGGGREGRVVTVDAHGGLFRFKGASLATPNQPEAEATLGRTLSGTAALEAGAQELLLGMNAEGVLVTRGSLGMAVLDRQGTYTELPPYQIAEVRDATGAGDTVAAVATLALAGGATVLDAARLSTVAAGLVVRRLGAATVTPEELRTTLLSAQALESEQTGKQSLT